MICYISLYMNSYMPGKECMIKNMKILYYQIVSTIQI